MQFLPIREIYPRAYREMENPPIGPGLPWMPKVTEYLGGLRPNEITLLCAPTGAGKTELLATLAAQLTLSGVSTFVAPVETGETDFVARVMSTVCRKNLNSGLRVSKEILDEMEKTQGERIRSLPLHVANYDNRVKIDEIEMVLEYAYKTENIQVALLDNLNFFLEVVDTNKEKMEMDNAVHQLVMFVKRCPIHIILIVHPRKTEGGRVESEFDIKGSSTAVQECHNIAMFNRPTKEHLESGRKFNYRELVFKKIRKRGFYCNKSIWLSYADGFYSEIISNEKPANPVASTGKNKQFVLGRDD